MIQIKNIYKKFESKRLFDGFSLEINQGDFIVFSGPSGCGKTTLLNMIGGIEPPDQGQIIVNDVDICRQKGQLKYFRDVVGFLFQNFALIEDKTVQQNLNLIKKNARTNITIEDALKRVDMMEEKNSKIYTLSGGEQQRIALARLMIKKCDYILADEPTGSLDRDNAKKVMNILKRLNKDGKTVILVSHDEEIKKEGNRIIEL